MEAEALPVISGLGLKRDSPPSLPPPAPATTFSGRVSSSSSDDKGNSSPSSVEVSVVCSGKCKVHGVDNIGTVPAALMTYLALSELRDPRVDLVISAGTAGGFAARGAAIGDVFCATAFANHDRRIPLAKFDDYGTWRSDAHPAPRMAAALGLKSGPVSTGNSLDWHDLDMASMSSGGAAVKDMEASGVAWACSLHGVPLLALKSVTDIVDGGKPAEEEFLANLATASEALHVALRGALEFVAGKGVDEL
jgi:5'-methylthioadenosine nucleosidase